MSAPDFQRLEQLFQAAADLPESEREAYLERECSGDLQLRKQVEVMLDNAGEESLAAPAVGPAASLEGAAIEGPGTVIDRYKLLQVIGEGGFGVVYMAEQQAPVVRKVALKIIKLGMDTKEVIARFEAERQALALMEHPNIASVLDGGATQTGRPYFVMELVRGIAITDYCDQNSLSTRDRLELFVQVCRAVEHAHQKGVIHRDLKPTNVLVTLHDGKPVPKVIDFGIAKAMHTRLTEKTLFTAFERFIGTPAYMSPEQAEMSGLDIDTRSDVYSLGILLYELLTGTTPFDVASLMREGLSEIKRVIREEPAPRPSLRISTTGDATLASKRSSDVRTLSRRMRGDLDWIVMRALEKERVRRYSTVSELAADIQRHLENAPVEAGPPSRIYRARKFLARNRAAAASVSVVSLVLVGGIIGTSAGMWEASQQRDQAVAAQIDAQREAAHARAVTDFLVEALALADPQFALESEVSVRQLLDRASGQVEGTFREQPRAEARVRATIGKAYKTLGESEVAEHHLRRAVEIIESLPDYDPIEHYDILWTLTHVCFRLEQPDALGVAKKARHIAHTHIRETYPELAAAMDEFDHAVAEAAFGSGGEAVRATLPQLFEKTCQLSDLVPAGDPLWPLIADLWMAAGYSFWFSPGEAISEPWYVKALEIQRRELPPNHPQIGETVGQLIGVLNRTGRAAEAEGYVRDTLEQLRNVYEPGNFQRAYVESMLGSNLAGQGRFEEAEALLLPAHDVIRETIRDDTKFYVSDSFRRLVQLYESWGREDEALPYRNAIAALSAETKMFQPWEIMGLAFGPDRPDLRAALERIQASCGAFVVSSSMHRAPKEPLDPWVDRILAERDLLPADDPRRIVVARALIIWGRVIAPGTQDHIKRRMVGDALAALEADGRIDDELIAFDVADAHSQLGEIALLEGRLQDAEEHSRTAWRVLDGIYAEDNWITAHAKVRVGRCLVQQKLYGQAEEILVSSYDVLRAQVGARNTDVETLAQTIADMYTAWGRPQEAERFLAAHVSR